MPEVSVDLDELHLVSASSTTWAFAVPEPDVEYGEHHAISSQVEQTIDLGAGDTSVDDNLQWSWAAGDDTTPLIDRHLVDGEAVAYLRLLRVQVSGENAFVFITN